ncbi:unnamed protein product, partial [Medioppia subpectinata]
MLVTGPNTGITDTISATISNSALNIPLLCLSAGPAAVSLTDRTHSLTLSGKEVSRLVSQSIAIATDAIVTNNKANKRYVDNGVIEKSIAIATDAIVTNNKANSKYINHKNHYHSNTMNVFRHIEGNFNTTQSHQWMTDHWHISVYLSIAYLCVIYGLKLQMQNRKPLDINGYLFAWNAFLTIFSTIGTLRAVDEMSHVLGNHGLKYSICSKEYHTYGSGLWGFLFSFSKSFELFDTVFLVLRKRPVILLHWYHHVTVLMFCWWSYSLNSSTGRWFTFVNYTVHMFMYAYYTLQSVGVKVPSVLAKAITMGQIFQMIFGLFINLASIVLKLFDSECGVDYKYIAISLAMYGSYYYLFYQFFNNRKPLEISGYLFIWNAFLTLFSIVGTFRLLDEMQYRLVNHGFGFSICSQEYHTQGSGLWIFLFIFSKSFELLDTVFLVLRKRPVIFLHWYHHVTVLMFCWWSYALNASTGRWYAFVNYIIHSIMYAYYALQSVQVKVPSALTKTITIGQILQMFFGLFITLMSFALKFYGNDCGVNYDYVGKWFVQNWHISVYLSIAYVCVIYVLKLWMRNKNAFKLNVYLICSQEYHTQGSGLWIFLFIFSKSFELLDTIFLVLRKKPVMLLHWYHHVTVLIFCWWSYSLYAGTGFWYAFVNYTVHSFMYTYYALQSMNVRVPSALSKAITIGQIFQMFFGLFITLMSFVLKFYGNGCGVSYDYVGVSIALYGSYFYLFYQFFKNRGLEEIQYRLENHGFWYSICSQDYHTPTIGLWGFLFIMSKSVELLDTLFLVLKKRPVILLHWYHHVTVLMFCWWSYSLNASTARWFAFVNYTVHSFMYAYYTLQSVQVKVPSALTKIITIGQIFQIFMETDVALVLNTLQFLSLSTAPVFSTIGTIRCGEEIYYRLVNYGFGYSICHKDLHTLRAGLWGLLFTLSKSIELLDTVFLVLRKKPVMFLHWYHHVTVLMFAWWTYSFMGSTGRWFAFVNYTVHSFMYSYYALQAVRVRVPSVLAKTITIVQILQMFFGCGVSFEHIGVSLTIYG